MSKRSVFPVLSRASLLAMLACVGGAVHAQQQTPITGQMLGPTATAASAPVQAAPPAAPTLAPPAPPSAAPAVRDSEPSRTRIGDATRQWLALQAQGNNAGATLPIPGQEASASYQRYLKSFSHPIPEFYETAVSGNGNRAGASGSMPAQ